MTLFTFLPTCKERIAKMSRRAINWAGTVITHIWTDEAQSFEILFMLQNYPHTLLDFDMEHFVTVFGDK